MIIVVSREADPAPQPDAHVGREIAFSNKTLASAPNNAVNSHKTLKSAHLPARSKSASEIELQLAAEEQVAPETCSETKVEDRAAQAMRGMQRGDPAFWRASYATPHSTSTNNLGCSVHKRYCTGPPSSIPCCHSLIAYMLFDLLDVLDTHNISWVICSGTALGVHRDGTLIPWDTRDIDIIIDPHPQHLQKAQEVILRFIDDNNLVILTREPLSFADHNHVYTRRYHEQYGYPPAGEFCFATPEFDWRFPEFRSTRTLTNRNIFIEISTDHWTAKAETHTLGTLAKEYGPSRSIKVVDFEHILKVDKKPESWRDGAPPWVSQEQLAFHGYVFRRRTAAES